ncbi:unnamed protein product [Brassicogethes aeneus]|uniref:Thioredoxin domain-containing protein 17 n=1 Tax=Brassicogethes aeneus TaxID=1431903 RepID=A0A9P0B2U9_BRAAE|nr:unnamed protein product [Brassicogethes aeneus]
MGLHREHINGYDDFCKFFEKFESKGKTVHVYFSGSKLENGESWCDDCIRAWPVIEGVLKKLEGPSQEHEESETKKIEEQVLETKEEKPKEAKKTKEQENKPKEAKKTKEHESKPKETKEPESKLKKKKEQDGKPEVAMETKEQESKTTEESAEKEESNESYFIYVEVGDRPTWKDPKSSFRTDKRTKVMVLPSIIRWEGHQRLIGDQCENPELVEMLFTDEDD